MVTQQDEQLVKDALELQSVLEGERSAWESIWREIDFYVDPTSQGGFDQLGSSPSFGDGLYNSTGIIGLNRYEAAMGALQFPRNARWHKLTTTDGELNKVSAVQRWCEYAEDRLFAMRYAAQTGFEPEIYSDIRQGGKYGTAPLWVDAWRGRGLFYRAAHLSEIYIDEDFRGRVNIVHRKFTHKARQAAEEFGPEALPEKIRDAANDPNKCDELFEFLHVLRPNAKRDPGTPGWKGMPIESLTIATDERWIVRRSGYHTMPMIVSRTSGTPRDKYGVSPAMNALGALRTTNEMSRTLLRGGHYAVLPPLLAHDDDDIRSFQIVPGGVTFGGLDEIGREMVKTLRTGEKLPYGFEMLEREEAPIRSAFLEEFFALLLDRGDRMTATEVLEIAAKQGALVTPMAARHETEKVGPMIERELDLGLRSEQILPPPPELLEASRAGQASLKIIHENPLSRMARTAEAAGFGRWIEQMAPLAAIDPTVFDHVDVDNAAPGLAAVLGVRPSWVTTPETIAAKRKAREEAEAAQSAIAALAGPKGGLADATLDLARAGEIRDAA